MPSRCVFVLVLVLGCRADQRPAQAPAGQNPSPMVDHTRRHERIERPSASGTLVSIDSLLEKPVELDIPEARDRRSVYKLLIHFHGASFVPVYAVDHAPEPYILAVVNLGTGSSAYEDAFADRSTFQRLIATIQDEVEARTGSRPEPVRVYLSAFSAGYGAVRAILRQESSFAAVKGVLLLDGLHTDYVPERTVLAAGGRLDSTRMSPFLSLAKAALEARKSFLITHSEIFPGTYASTTETADYLLQTLGLERTAVLKWGPVGMQQLSEVRKGSFEVLGFAGNTAPDHMDHLHGLPQFLTVLSDLERPLALPATRSGATSQEAGKTSNVN